jgi:AcrR family transcriptional regulator
MDNHDHRPRVAAERRERMRSRLLGTALQLVAERGPAALSIDDVIAGAEVSRGTFYKYFPSPDALVREVAFSLATDLVQLADPVVRLRDDPAERVACGIRLVSRLALHHPAAAGFLVQLGWPDTESDNVLLAYVRRDVEEGIRRGRFRKPACARDFAELSAAAALRALGLPAKSADAIAFKPLEPVTDFPEGLLTATLPATDGLDLP